ncbi:purine-cytosine permease family protein [Rhodococcus sp. NPDC057529]|uniref:purine-cytosine permease family protein n=1 Tax=Rhodococcus sp. NPDC057529 TaxID=3346158 RepID=UPI003671BDDF
MSPTSEADASSIAGVEVRSIGYIPRSERFGRPRNQFTLWFGSTLNITALVTGAAAMLMTGEVLWTIVGLLVGLLFGGTVMALHSVQGPRLGLPQMISSRAQFGVYGATIPLVLALVMYVGYASVGSILAGQAIGELTHISDRAGIIVFGLLTALVTIVGYRLIHVMGRASTVIGSIAFIFLTYRMVVDVDLGDLLADSQFSLPNFLLAVALAASYQVTFGPYVADYSRYLPYETSSVKTFTLTLSGTVLGTFWGMSFGVLAAAVAGPAFRDNEVGSVVAIGGAGLVAALLYFAIAFGKLTVNVLNCYGGFMCLVTAVTGFRGYREIAPRTRTLTILFIMLIATLIGLFASENFLSSFSSLLLFLLAFFTPWSAINLIDFYCISKERYDVPALSDPNGRYGKWNTIAIVSYFLGLLVQIPFLYTTLYTGPMVEVLGGVDVSWIVGLLVPGIVYYVWSRLATPVYPGFNILPDDATYCAPADPTRTGSVDVAPADRSTVGISPS